MRCLVLFRYVLCLVTFFKPLDTQEQGKVFENKKKTDHFCSARRDFSLAWLLVFMKFFAWLVCCLEHKQTNHGTDKLGEPLHKC